MVNSIGKTYTMIYRVMLQLLIMTLAFLIGNRLMTDVLLIVYTDGAREIKKTLDSIFRFMLGLIIVDWRLFNKIKVNSSTCRL